MWLFDWLIDWLIKLNIIFGSTWQNDNPNPTPTPHLTINSTKLFYMMPMSLSYVHICVEQLQSGDGRILTFQLCYVHTYAEWTRRICHFLRTKMVWGARFPSGHRKLGVGPICWGADFIPARPPLHNRTFVNACNDLCSRQFSARLRLRPLCACVNVPLEMLMIAVTDVYFDFFF